MHTFIRFNGKEVQFENMRATDTGFLEAMRSALAGSYGKKSLLSIGNVENFANPKKTDEIFDGVFAGKLEGECPIEISVFVDCNPDTIDWVEDIPEPDFTVSAFIGFRK